MSAKSIDFNKTVYELCSEDPQIIELLVSLGFNDITKPGMLNTAGRFMTIPKGAAMKKLALETIKQVFIENGYEVKL
jgi:hypothetical protein